MEADACYSVGLYSTGGRIKSLKNPNEGILLDHILKFALNDDTTTGRKKGDVLGCFVLPDGWFGVTEPMIAPKLGDKNGSTYLMVIGIEVSIGTQYDIGNGNKSHMRSQEFVVDGDDLDAGSDWSFDLPYHVTYGLHSWYLDWDRTDDSDIAHHQKMVKVLVIW